MNANTNSTPVNVNWGEQKSKLKAMFPALTDSDLNYENGRKDEMLGKLQTKLGKSKEELQSIISSL